jgi:hypothetical protein
LHIRVLTDGFYGLHVRKAQLVLDKKGPDDHARRLVARSVMDIMQTAVIDLFDLLPGKGVAQLYPPVALREILKRGSECFKCQLPVL